MHSAKRAIGLGALVAITLAVSGGPAWAQDYGVSSGSLYTGGGTSYIPYGANMSGFVPYTPGPGGGLGVQARMPQVVTRPPAFGLGMQGGMGGQLGQVRTSLVPLRPLSTSGMGMGGGGLIRRAPAGGAPAMGGGMGGAGRPPVGNYPFRQPPSLVSPTSGPSMSM